MPCCLLCQPVCWVSMLGSLQIILSALAQTAHLNFWSKTGNVSFFFFPFPFLCWIRKTSCWVSMGAPAKSSDRCDSGREVPSKVGCLHVQWAGTTRGFTLGSVAQPRAILAGRAGCDWCESASKESTVFPCALMPIKLDFCCYNPLLGEAERQDWNKCEWHVSVFFLISEILSGSLMFI